MRTPATTPAKRPTRRAPAARAALLALAAALIAAAVAAGAPGPAQATGYKLFGTNEIQSKTLDKFTKWTELLTRYDGEAPNELNVCQPTAAEKCHIARWRIFLKQIAALPPMEQLQRVNQYVNDWLYVLDPVNYNQKDYWATPREFMYRNGDCEDYAFAKYVSLVHLGFPKEQMRLVVLQDLNLQIPHAVLVVYVEGVGWLLDNQIGQVIEANRVQHYKPIFSINEQAWWLHRG